ncbi:MAG: hypothetical protein MUO19_07885, partial [Dehalococcoidales bacterium]|nr:hypothetical protein [Dehalococcoidales bacterium]
MKNAVKPLNLAGTMQRRLPPDVSSFIRKAGKTSERRQQRLYLVGGAVRDIILSRDTVDIDLVVEGDGIALAEALAGSLGARVTSHQRFGTATLKWDNLSADIATARAESYVKPGALPRVRPGT